MPRRIVFPEQGKVELQSFELPDAGDEDITVRTIYSLMSIGTETAILHRKYATGTHYDRIFGFPQLKTGVQAIAEVESVGSNVTEFEVGDLIYMRMAHGSHQVIPGKLCSPVPSGIDLEKACWCGLAKTAFRAAWAGDFENRSTVLFVGAGPVGQMAIRWASAMDVSDIIVADLSEFRLQHAKAGGAHRLLHGSLDDFAPELAELETGAGPSLAVDCTGSPAAFPMVLGSVGAYGKVILLGDTGFPEQQHLTSDVMTKGLTIQATHDSHDRDGWTQRRVDAHFFEQLAAARFRVDGLITHRFSPADCVEAYALASDHRDQAIGILYDWGAL